MPTCFAANNFLSCPNKQHAVYEKRLAKIFIDLRKKNALERFRKHVSTTFSIWTLLGDFEMRSRFKKAVRRQPKEPTINEVLATLAKDHLYVTSATQKIWDVVMVWQTVPTCWPTMLARLAPALTVSNVYKNRYGYCLSRSQYQLSYC